MSLRASITSELYLDNVRVPDENRLPGAKGLKGPLGCLTQARYGITWGVIGAAIACFDEATEYCKTRVLFDRPLVETQTIQRRLADMARRITPGAAVVFAPWEAQGRGKDETGSGEHGQVEQRAHGLGYLPGRPDILGGSGITTEYCPIRHMLNLESVITYEGTETVHELIVGKAVTGASAF